MNQCDSRLVGLLLGRETGSLYINFSLQFNEETGGLYIKETGSLYIKETGSLYINPHT